MKQARTEINYKIGQNIKRLRKQSKLTQSNLADQIKVSYQQIQKFEHGRNRIFAHQLLELCELNNWNLNEFKASESSVSDLNS